ncbi:YgaP family membrane protein [Acidithiobacillus sp.]
MKLQKNMLPIERWLRIYFGVIIVLVYFFNPYPYSWWTFSGYLVIATGAFGYCPIYGFLNGRKKSDGSTPTVS